MSEFIKTVIIEKYSLIFLNSYHISNCLFNIFINIRYRRSKKDYGNFSTISNPTDIFRSPPINSISIAACRLRGWISFITLSRPANGPSVTTMRSPSIKPVDALMQLLSCHRHSIAARSSSRSTASLVLP